MERFNPATYTLIDNITGEEVDVAMFISKVSESGWEKTYTDMLARYVGITGNKSCQVLAYLIKEKTDQNIVYGTFDEIAKYSKTSPYTVKTVMTLLKNKGYLKKIRNGRYMLTPKMIRYGSDTKGAMLLRIWETIE